ncbi:enoyl-CoA hydratase/isomerase family protein [bacterium]|nr:enoyl-CoA hydratase/isomerase family protein [FCB group bacterium]MBL7190808.1 enoyl-CoA hydratase/isomerase family protein [bacterium]
MEFIKTSYKDGLYRLTLDNPPLNILNTKMMQEMWTAIIEVCEISDIKLLIIQAEGKAFSAGADVGEHLPDKVDEMIHAFDRIFLSMCKVKAPVISLVQGACLGAGCEIALFSDMVIASDKAKFGQPEILLGAIPPIAAAVLPRMIGMKKAMEIILTGRTYTAAEWLSMKLANYVYPAEEFASESENFIAKLAALSAPVLQIAKKSILASNQIDFTVNVNEAEKIYLGKLVRLHDAEEGLRAFMEKRKPIWRNE